MNKTFANHIPTIRRPSHDLDDGVPQDATIDVGAIFKALWNGKITILIAMVICIVLGIYYAGNVAVPKYRSTAVVILNSQQEQVVDIASVMSGLSPDTTVVNSEVEVLRSRSLLGDVVKKLDLVDDPEFNSSLIPPSALSKLKQSITNTLHIGGSEEQIPEETLKQRQFNGAVDMLRSILTVRNVPLSLVFEVTIETTDAQKSALIADTLVNLYVQNQLAVKFDATEQATTWLSERVFSLQEEVEESEARVKAFNSSTDLIGQEALEAQERQLKELRDRIASTELEQSAAQQRLSALQAAQTPQEKAVASNDTQLQNLLRRLDDSSVDMQAAFNARFNQLVARASLDIQRAEAQIQSLEKAVVDLSTQIDRQSADFITLQQLTREAEASKNLYEYFLGRLKETSAQKGIQQADSRVLSQAVVPNLASSPKKMLILIASAVLGMMIGVLIVLIRELRSDTYRTAEALEMETGLAVMGQIPLIAARRRQDAITYLSSKPTSVATEAVRNLRTSILLSNVDATPKVILLSSSFPGEGKTTLSMALAMNMASLGKRVLLIEGDIRRRIFGQYFKVEDSLGFVSVMTGECSLEDAVITENTLGVDILMAEKFSGNAADLFASEKFQSLIQHVRELYDMVLIDSAPVLVVPDARVISQTVDATLMVVKWDHTQKSQVAAAQRMFESVNQPLTGLILNQIDPKGMRRYYGRGYGSYGAYSYGRQYYSN